MIADLIDRYKKTREKINRVDNVISSVINEKKDILLSLNKDQMLLGRNASGEILSPSYLNDPYFDNKVKAESYAVMKQRLQPTHDSMIKNPTIYPNKDKNTPNLIVSGPFQNSMFITTSENEFIIGSTYIDSYAIENKYNNDVFGIAPSSAMFFYEHYIRPAILKLIYNTNEL